MDGKKKELQDGDSGAAEGLLSPGGERRAVRVVQELGGSRGEAASTGRLVRADGVRGRQKMLEKGQGGKQEKGGRGDGRTDRAAGRGAAGRGAEGGSLEEEEAAAGAGLDGAQRGSSYALRTHKESRERGGWAPDDRPLGQEGAGDCPWGGEEGGQRGGGTRNNPGVPAVVGALCPPTQAGGLPLPFCSSRGPPPQCFAAASPLPILWLRRAGTSRRGLRRPPLFSPPPPTRFPALRGPPGRGTEKCGGGGERRGRRREGAPGRCASGSPSENRGGGGPG